MRNGLKRATALAMTILMLLALLPAALAEGTELHSDGVVPGLSDGGDLAALLDEVNAADGVASANALLAAYGGISALADGVPIDRGYYSISVDGATVENDYKYKIEEQFTSGDVGEGTVPTVTPIAGGEPLEFVGAYINNAAVTYVGTLEHEGTTYVFYTTAENESSMAATVLGGNDKIELRYTAASEVPISYEVSGDWDSAWGSQDEALDAIFGSDRPTAVLAGGSYNVEAQIPRGYMATVTVLNGNDRVSVYQLGVEPTYSRDGNQIDKSGELELETLISNDGTSVSAEQTVRIELTHRESYTFNRALWVQTEYASGRLTDERVVTNFNGGADQQLLWRFTTKNDTQWEMDGLQINGTQLNIPYVANNRNDTDSAVTVLPSGTTVTLTVECNSRAGGGHYTRTYTLHVSNCYENITVSGGNLNNSGSWHEIIPEKLVGVNLQVYSYKNENRPNDRDWKDVSQSEPFSAHNDNNDPSRNNYILGTDGIRFTLQDGYVNPQVRYYDKSGNSQMDRNVYVSGPDRDDYYTIRIDEHRCGSDTFTFLEIVADVGNYSVSYDAGVPQEGTSWQTMPDVPAEQTGYNIVVNKQIGISNEIPIDPTNQYVFHHWKLEGYEGEIEPGQTIDLEDVVALAVDQELELVAVWQPAATAEYITYQVQFQKDGVDVEGELYTFQTARLATGRTTVVILEHAEEIQNFLNENPNYKLDSENVYLHNDVENGDILHINFVKADTTVTITKLISGSMGDRQREFAFTVTSDKPFGEPEGNAYTLSDELTASFKLGHEGSVTLNVPIGATLTITETNADDYDVSAEGATEVEGKKASFTLTVNGGEQVTVTNNKVARPDTGIVTDSLPYVLILACVIAVVVVVVIRGRNRHDD